MITIDNYEVIGWEHAIRGMRNPLNSWSKSDSRYSCLCMDDKRDCPVEPYIIGPNDYKLMTNLRNAGTDHRKYMRMITVYVDITAPLYFWKEFDTYKIGSTANSCSTMHKIHEKEFTLNDFSGEHLLGRHHLDGSCAMHSVVSSTSPLGVLKTTIKMLNLCREQYLESKNKIYWWQMIQLLPSSYNQKRTVMLNYEVLANMYKSRKNHKLDEWREFCEWIEELPYSELITGKVDTFEK